MEKKEYIKFIILYNSEIYIYIYINDILEMICRNRQIFKYLILINTEMGIEMVLMILI